MLHVTSGCVTVTLVLSLTVVQHFSMYLKLGIVFHEQNETSYGTVHGNSKQKSENQKKRSARLCAVFCYAKKCLYLQQKLIETSEVCKTVKYDFGKNFYSISE